MSRTFDDRDEDDDYEDTTCSASEANITRSHDGDDELERRSLHTALRNSMQTWQIDEAEQLARALDASRLMDDDELEERVAEARWRSGQEVDARQLEADILERALWSSVKTASMDQARTSGGGYQHFQRGPPATVNDGSAHYRNEAGQPPVLGSHPSARRRTDVPGPSGQYGSHRGHMPGTLDPPVTGFRRQEPSLVQGNNDAASYFDAGLRPTQRSPSVATFGRAFRQAAEEESARHELYQKIRAENLANFSNEVPRRAGGRHGYQDDRDEDEDESEDGEDNDSSEEKSDDGVDAGARGQR